MSDLTPRQHRWWIAAGLYLLFIYASVPFIRGLTNPLRDANRLRFTVGWLFAFAALAFAVWLWRHWPGWRRAALLIPILALYGWVLQQAHQPEEQLHLIQYGLLGLLLHAACRARQRERRAESKPPDLLSRRPALSAILLASLGGWGDEGIQYLIPERYYDLRDVAFNCAAAALAISISALVPTSQTPQGPHQNDPISPRQS